MELLPILLAGCEEKGYSDQMSDGLTPDYAGLLGRWGASVVVELIEDVIISSDFPTVCQEDIGYEWYSRICQGDAEHEECRTVIRLADQAYSNGCRRAMKEIQEGSVE